MIDCRLPGARVIFSTRQGGVSEGPFESLNLGLMTGDVRERVLENRLRLFSQTGVESVAMGRQVHGTDIREWEASTAEHPEADGHITAVRGLAMLVFVADCLPVALAGQGRLAMLHCGWRGLAGGIVEKALATFPEPPAAAIGPGIGGCCYEVGEEVLAAFADLDGVARGGMLDLRAVVRHKLAAGGVTRDRGRAPVHVLPSRPVLLASPRPRGDRPPGRPRLARMTLDPRRVRDNLDRVHERISAAGRDPATVEICAAIKYLPPDDLPALAEAGIKLVGENRAQALREKQVAHGDLFFWDFIGALQSRKVREVAPRVRLIHSVATDSALAQLERHPVAEVLIEVNVAGEEGKAGIAPDELAAFIERSPRPGHGADDDAARGRARRGQPASLRPPRRARRRASPDAAVDGHVAGLRRRGGRRGDDRSPRRRALFGSLIALLLQVGHAIAEVFSRDGLDRSDQRPGPCRPAREP